MKRLVLPTTVLLTAVLLSGCADQDDPDLSCASRPAQVLAAQSVPSAAYVPCITDIHDPWTIISTDTDQDRSVIKLAWGESEGAGQSATVTLVDSCATATGIRVESTDQPGVVVTTEESEHSSRTVYEFDGGCVQVLVDRLADAEVTRLSSHEFTVALVSRQTLNQYVLDQTSGRVGLDPEV